VRSCPVCGSESHMTDSFHPAALHKCGGCGLLFNAAVHPHLVDELYEGDVYAADRMAAHTSDRQFDSRKRAAWVRRSAAGSRLLDVGAGTGFFVAAAGECGFVAIGIEPSDLAARFGREQLGVDVRTGYLEQLELAPGPFDAITMWHVLEHVPDPVALLRTVRARLDAGGVLFVEVPNIESVGAEIFAGRWAHLDHLAHACHFAPRSLAIAVERAGFEVVELVTLLDNYYDSPRARWRPRRVAGRLIRSARLGTVRLTHPARGELLRVRARAIPHRGCEEQPSDAGSFLTTDVQDGAPEPARRV
jgi:SAM-dependent methyltransferase